MTDDALAIFVYWRLVVGTGLDSRTAIY